MVAQYLIFKAKKKFFLLISIFEHLPKERPQLIREAWWLGESRCLSNSRIIAFRKTNIECKVSCPQKGRTAQHEVVVRPTLDRSQGHEKARSVGVLSSAEPSHQIFANRSCEFFGKATAPGAAPLEISCFKKDTLHGQLVAALGPIVNANHKYFMPKRKGSLFLLFDHSIRYRIRLHFSMWEVLTVRGSFPTENMKTRPTKRGIWRNLERGVAWRVVACRGVAKGKKRARRGLQYE